MEKEVEKKEELTWAGVLFFISLPFAAVPIVAVFFKWVAFWNKLLGV